MNNKNKNNSSQAYTRLYKPIHNTEHPGTFSNANNKTPYKKPLNPIPFSPIYVKKNKDLQIPKLATYGSAAYDIFANEDVVLKPNVPTAIGTGLQMAIPQSHYMMVCSRSGLCLNNNVYVFNAPGIIDSDFRGELKIILKNDGHEDFIIKKQDRIAQCILQQKIRINFKEVDELTNTDRSNQGFGSTGIDKPIDNFSAKNSIKYNNSHNSDNSFNDNISITDDDSEEDNCSLTECNL